MPASLHSIQVQVQLLESGLRSQLGGISQQMTGMQTQATRLGNQMRAAFAFHEMERFGRAADRMFGGIIDQAAQFQQAMTKVSIATNATGKELKGLNDLVLKQSSLHAMSTSQAADMLSVMARTRTGMTPEALKAAFPSVAKFADVENLERGMSFEQSAKLASQTAQLFGARTSADTESTLNALYKAMNMTPISPQQLMKMVSQFHGVAKYQGLSTDAQFQAAALLGTMGLGGRGGTEFMDVLIRSMGQTSTITGHHQAKQMAALQRLGLLGMHGENLTLSGGKLDLNLMIEKLIGAGSKLDPQVFIQSMVQGLGLQGTKLGTVLADPAALKNLEEMQAGWGRVTDLQTAYERELGTLTYQTHVLATNFDSLQAVLGEGTLGPLTSFNKWMGEIVAPDGPLARYAKAHSDLAAALVIGGKFGGKTLEIGGQLGQIIIALEALKKGFAGGAFKIGLVAAAATTGYELGEQGAKALHLDTEEGRRKLLGTLTPALLAAGPAGTALATALRVANTILEHSFTAKSDVRLTPHAEVEYQHAVATGQIVVTGPIHIHANNTADFAKELNRQVRTSSMRSPSSSPTTPGYSPASGPGGN